MASSSVFVPRLSRTFPPEPRAVAAARHAVEAVDGLIPSRRETPCCCWSGELVSNSVRHAELAAGAGPPGPVVHPGAVRVQVTDDGPDSAPPPSPDPGDLAAGGWGLFLVEELADRWGVEQGERTRVWFEVDI